jgi:hypothetical protein
MSSGGRNTCGSKINQMKSLECIGNDEQGQNDIPKVQMYNSIEVKTGWDYSFSLNL